MLTNEFEKIWLSIFKDSTDKLILPVFLDELKKTGILLKKEDEEKFLDIWTRFRADESNDHHIEFMKVANILVKQNIMFDNAEMQAKIKLKIAMEKNLIRWIIDNYDKQSIRDLLDMLLNTIKLEPKHFTDITCQSLYRLVLYRFSKGHGVNLESLLDTKAENLGLGAISTEEFVEFYAPDAGRPVNEDFDSMIDYATKIVELNDLIKTGINQ